MHDAASKWLNNYYMQIKQVWVASIFVIGSHSEVLIKLWMWSWQDADAERVMGAQPAAVRYEGSDLSWLSAPQQLRAWSQPRANAAQMYSSAPFCVPELNVLSELIWNLLDSALKNNTSLTVTKRAIICDYRMNVRAVICQLCVRTLLIVLISNRTPLGWRRAP